MEWKISTQKRTEKVENKINRYQNKNAVPNHQSRRTINCTAEKYLQYDKHIVKRKRCTS